MQGGSTHFNQEQQGYPPQGYAQPQQGYPPQGYGQPPQGYPPGASVQMVPQGYVLKKDGYTMLTERSGIFIKQKMELLEMLTGCETENTYNVHSLGQGEEKGGEKLLKCKEKSSWCARNCLTGDCRPFEMNIMLDSDKSPFLRLDRPCACTICCLNRPELSVFYVQDGKNDFIGKVVDDFNCCDISLSIKGKDGEERFKVHGNCCQLGLHCHAPCESCQNVLFELKSPSGETISTIKKKSAGCLQAMVTDMDNFAVEFPQNATKEDRALIMAATLFLDFRYFEEQQERKNNNAMF